MTRTAAAPICNMREILLGGGLDSRSWCRHHRRDTTVADALEAVGEIGRRLEARLGTFFETAVDRALEIHRHRGAGGRELRRLLLEDGGDDLGAGVAAEGAVARGHLVDDAAEGEDVRSGVGGLALDLLGGHVAGGAHDGAGLGDGGGPGVGRGLLVDGRETEVEDLDPAVGGEEEVFGFDVSVDDPAAVRGGETVGHRGADGGHLLPGKPGRSDPLAQGVALEQLGDGVVDSVGGAHIVDIEEVGVGQTPPAPWPRAGNARAGSHPRRRTRAGS